MNRLLSKKEETEINLLSPQVIEIKQKICSTVNNDCKKCPLGVEDVCSQLELKEFDFNDYRWIEDNVTRH